MACIAQSKYTMTIVKITPGALLGRKVDDGGAAVTAREVSAALIASLDRLVPTPARQVYPHRASGRPRGMPAGEYERSLDVPLREEARASWREWFADSERAAVPEQLQHAPLDAAQREAVLASVVDRLGLRAEYETLCSSQAAEAKSYLVDHPEYARYSGYQPQCDSINGRVGLMMQTIKAGSR